MLWKATCERRSRADVRGCSLGARLTNLFLISASSPSLQFRNPIHQQICAQAFVVCCGLKMMKNMKKKKKSKNLSSSSTL
jgi:hypothetical protein